MASEKQNEANRNNAQKSTGPKSVEGKRRSSMNAFKHSMRANQILPLPGEDPRELQEFAEAVYVEMTNVGFVGDNLIFGITYDMIRIRRLNMLEAALLWGSADQVGPAADRSQLSCETEAQEKPENIQAEQGKIRTAKTFDEEEEDGIETLEGLIGEPPLKGAGGKELQAMAARFVNNIHALELIRRYRVSAENSLWRKMGVFGRLSQAKGRAMRDTVMDMIYNQYYARDAREDRTWRDEPTSPGESDKSDESGVD